MNQLPKGMKFTLKARNFNEYLNAVNGLSDPKTVAVGKNKDANGVANREQNITDVKGGGKGAETKGTDRTVNKLVVEGKSERAKRINKSISERVFAMAHARRMKKGK